MNLKKKVEKTMKGAIERIAKVENVEKSKVALFIHTPRKDSYPAYTYAVNNQMKMEDEENFKLLDYVRDILGKKADLLNTQSHLTTYINMFYDSIADELESNEADSTNVQIRMDYIVDKDQLLLHLIKGQSLIRRISLDEIMV